MPRQVPSGPVALPPIPFRAKATIPNPGKTGLAAPLSRGGRKGSWIFVTRWACALPWPAATTIFI